MEEANSAPSDLDCHRIRGTGRQGCGAGVSETAPKGPDELKGMRWRSPLGVGRGISSYLDQATKEIIRVEAKILRENVLPVGEDNW